MENPKQDIDTLRHKKIEIYTLVSNYIKYGKHKRLVFSIFYLMFT